jgi:hypothetical protein
MKTAPTIALMFAPLFATLCGCTDRSLNSPNQGPGTISVTEISDGKRLIGETGRPIFTIIKVTGVLIDASDPRRKDGGDGIVLKVLTVDGIALKTPVLIKARFTDDHLRFDDGSSMIYPTQHTLRNHIGKSVTCFAYETIRADGDPDGCYEYFAVMSAVGTSHVSSHLVVMSDTHNYALRKAERAREQAEEFGEN